MEILTILKMVHWPRLKLFSEKDCSQLTQLVENWKKDISVYCPLLESPMCVFVSIKTKTKSMIWQSGEKVWPWCRVREISCNVQVTEFIRSWIGLYHNSNTMLMLMLILSYFPKTVIFCNAWEILRIPILVLCY